MPNYQQGKIYKITSGELTYIGSTCEPTLARRLAGHITGFKRWKEGKGNKNTSYSIFEKGNYEITLLELCQCNSKDELTARERFYIETTICVNKYIPGRTSNEYYQEHADKIKEQHKEYNQNNIEKRKQQRKKHYQENADILKQKSKEFYNIKKNM